MTADRFQHAYPTLSESLKETSARTREGTSQTPTSYNLPNPVGPLAPGIESNLWGSDQS